MSSGTATVVFVASLVLAVVLHELGHLVTAKRFGMRADRFFVGFGPTLWSRRVGETTYGLKALPLGGFVRVMGMSPEDERLGSVGEDVVATVAAAGTAPDAPAPAPSRDVPALEAAVGVELDRRGAPAAVRRDVIAAVREELARGGTDGATAARIDAAVARVVGAPAAVGDLAHRLLLGDRGRAFPERPAWQRAVVLVTGPLSHLVIAAVVLAVAYLALPQPTGRLEPVVGAVVEGSVAAEAGLVTGDRLLAVGDVASEDFAVLREAIRSAPGVSLVVVVERDGARRTVRVTPRAEVDPGTGERVGVLGIAPRPESVRLAPGEALVRAIVGTPDERSPGGVVPMLTASVDGLVRILSPSGLADLLAQAGGLEERDPGGAVSLVGAASVAGQLGGSGAYGLTVFLALIASINVFFALFNLVPLPPFDGGHLAVLAVERGVNAVRRARGRTDDYRVDPRTVSAVAAPVVAVLVVLLVATLWLDLTAPIRLG